MNTQQAYKRAGGRRKRHRMRTLAAEVRRAEIARLLRSGEVGPPDRRGIQARLALVLGVDPSVISRDMAAMREAAQGACCPVCGRSDT